MDYPQIPTTPSQAIHKQLTVYDLVSPEKTVGERISALQAIASAYEKNGEFINAFDLYKELADKDNDSVSQQRVGAMLVEGKNVTQNKHLGITYLLASAEQGNTAAVSKLHEIYIKLKSSEDKGVIQHFCNATSHGDAQAARALGQWFLTGENKAFLVDFLITAATTKSDADAVMVLGEWYLNSKDNNLKNPAISGLKAVVEIAPDKASYILGRIYIVLRIEEKAIQYLKLASENGNTDAMCLLGKIYGGEFCALPFLLTPNEKNCTHTEAINTAINHVATHQTEADKAKWGLSSPLCEPDWRKAELYFLQAAKAKNPEAMYLLGLGYLNHGNKQEAARFIVQANELNYPAAVYLAEPDHLAEKFVPEEVYLAKSNRLAEKFVAGNVNWMEKFLKESTYTYTQQERLERCTIMKTEEARIYSACNEFVHALDFINPRFYDLNARNLATNYMNSVINILDPHQSHPKVHHQLWYSVAVSSYSTQFSGLFIHQTETDALYRQAYRAESPYAALNLAESALKMGLGITAEAFFSKSIEWAKVSGKEDHIKEQINLLRIKYVPPVPLSKRIADLVSYPKAPDTFEESNAGL